MGCGAPYEDRMVADPSPVLGRNVGTDFCLSPTLGSYTGMSGSCVRYVPYDDYSGSVYSIYPRQDTADDLRARGMEREPLPPSGEQGPVSFLDKVAQMWRGLRSKS